MAELHSHIYYKHDDPEIIKLLDSLFYESEGDIEKITSLCKSINPERGTALLGDLIDSIDETARDITAEAIGKVEGYSLAQFMHGSGGDYIIEDIIEFLYSLCPDIHAQAWGCGDDDPWEYWIKFENGSLVREDDEPEMDEDEDEEILNTIYSWWHKSLPSAIKEGLLNDINIEDEYVVFTGKMENGTREEMEELAGEYGANVQKSINGKTTLLVVGKKAGQSKLNKADEFGVRIISEAVFNNIVEQ